MPSSTFSFNSLDRPLRGILLGIVAIVVLEAALHLLPNPTMTDMAKRREGLRTPPAADILVLGDSVAAGIEPAEMMKILGPTHDWQVENHAHYATGPEFAYFFLQRMVDAGTAPRVIWFAPSPHTMRNTRWALFFGSYAGPRESLQVAWQTGTYDDLSLGLASRASWTLRYRGAIATALRGDPSYLMNVVFDTPQKTTQERAGDDSTSYFTMETLPRGIYDQPFVVDPQVDVYTRAFCKLAQDQGILLVWDSMPVLPVVEEARRAHGFEEAYRAYLEELTVTYGVVSRFEHFRVFPEDEFRDFSHIAQDKMEHCHQDLAERWSADPAILKALSQPRP